MRRASAKLFRSLNEAGPPQSAPQTPASSAATSRARTKTRVLPSSVCPPKLPQNDHTQKGQFPPGRRGNRIPRRDFRGSGRSRSKDGDLARRVRSANSASRVRAGRTIAVCLPREASGGFPPAPSADASHAPMHDDKAPHPLFRQQATLCQLQIPPPLAESPAQCDPQDQTPICADTAIGQGSNPNRPRIREEHPPRERTATTFVRGRAPPRESPVPERRVCLADIAGRPGRGNAVRRLPRSWRHVRQSGLRIQPQRRRGRQESETFFSVNSSLRLYGSNVFFLLNCHFVLIVCRNGCNSSSGRRFRLPWTWFWGGRPRLRRSLFQYFHDRVSGDFDRPLLQRPNRGHDLSAHRQLWRQSAGR